MGETIPRWCSISSSTRKGRCCRRRKPSSRPITSGCSARTSAFDFNRLLTITNQPISRFGSTLVSKGIFRDYMALLRSAHRDDNLDGVMCRNLVSVDWRGYLVRLRLQSDAGDPAARAGPSRESRAPGRSAGDRSGRQSDRDRRSLLRMHRRARLVVRRRARRIDAPDDEHDRCGTRCSRYCRPNLPGVLQLLTVILCASAGAAGRSAVRRRRAVRQSLRARRDRTHGRVRNRRHANRF